MKEAATDYSAFQEKPVAHEAFDTLGRLVAQSQAKEKEIEQLSKQLKDAQEAYRDLTWKQIPDQMDQLGLENFTHKGTGLSISIKEEIETSITEERRTAAHKWLDDNGHSGLLKRNVTVAFNKDQQEDAASLASQLADKYPAVSTDMKVHPSSLKAWVKEMLKDGKDLPLEMFGVFRRRVAKFGKAKAK